MVKTILSLCDYTGNWPKYYRDAGYLVESIDLKRGDDVRLLKYRDFPVYGILAAPDCSSFANSGARHFKGKDERGVLLDSLALVDACLRAVAIYRPHFWALENPVGRLKQWLGPPRLYFHPCDYGDAYEKRTCIWGDFNIPRLDLFTTITTEAVEPIRPSWVHWMGGGTPAANAKRSTLRSVTPLGFAKAFFEANP